MNKNVKKIISTIIITMSIFALVGCGRTKEELKQNDIQTSAEPIKSAKESLIEFENDYKKYNDDMNISLSLLYEGYNPDGHIDIKLEQAQEMKREIDILKDELIKDSLVTIKDIIISYTSTFDEYFRVYGQTSNKEIIELLFKTLEGYRDIIENKLASIHSRID